MLGQDGPQELGGTSLADQSGDQFRGLDQQATLPVQDLAHAAAEPDAQQTLLGSASALHTTSSITEHLVFDEEAKRASTPSAIEADVLEEEAERWDGSVVADRDGIPELMTPSLASGEDGENQLRPLSPIREMTDVGTAGSRDVHKGRGAAPQQDGEAWDCWPKGELNSVEKYQQIREQFVRSRKDTSNAILTR